MVDKPNRPLVYCVVHDGSLFHGLAETRVCACAHTCCDIVRLRDIFEAHWKAIDVVFGIAFARKKRVPACFPPSAVLASPTRRLHAPSHYPSAPVC